MSSNSNAENNHENMANDSEEKYNGLLYEIEDLEKVIISQFRDYEAKDKIVKFSVKVALDSNLIRETIIYSTTNKENIDSSNQKTSQLSTSVKLNLQFKDSI
ncbi:10518_t:CDS:2, partial [Acaulospora morrowiae]